MNIGGNERTYFSGALSLLHSKWHMASDYCHVQVCSQISEKRSLFWRDFRECSFSSPCLVSLSGCVFLVLRNLSGTR